MRVMVLVKGTPESEENYMPSEEELSEMTTFNEELVKAGVMLDGEGLHPTANSARVSWSNNEVTVTDGPFTEAKEFVAGYWVWQVRSLDEAKEWAKRIPNFGRDGAVELRPIFEADDFGDAYTPELREREDEIRRQTAK